MKNKNIVRAIFLSFFMSAANSNGLNFVPFGYTGEKSEKNLYCFYSHAEDELYGSCIYLDKDGTVVDVTFASKMRGVGEVDKSRSR